MFSFNFKIVVLIKVEVQVNKHRDLDKGSGGDAGLDYDSSEYGDLNEGSESGEDGGLG